MGSHLIKREQTSAGTIHHLPCPARTINSVKPIQIRPASHQFVPNDEAGCSRDAKPAGDAAILVNHGLSFTVHVERIIGAQGNALHLVGKVPA